MENRNTKASSASCTNLLHVGVAWYWNSFWKTKDKKNRNAFPPLTPFVVFAINFAVITNNSICRRSLSDLTGQFDNRVYQWKSVQKSLPRQGLTRAYEVRISQGKVCSLFRNLGKSLRLKPSSPSAIKEFNKENLVKTRWPQTRKEQTVRPACCNYAVIIAAQTQKCANGCPEHKTQLLHGIFLILEWRRQ